MLAPTRLVGPVPRAFGDPWEAARLALWVTVVGTLARLVMAWVLPYGTGEAYYIASARTLQWSWFDQPPLFLWLVWAWKTVTGFEAPFLVRLPFVALFVGSTVLMWTLARLLFGAWAAGIAVLLLNIAPVFGLSVASWVQPDGPLILLWLAVSLMAARLMLVEPRPDNAVLWWVGIGLLLGLALLAKYHALFLIAGIGLFALTTRGQRSWVIHPGPWIAMALALLCFLPVVLWNAGHDWASFAFQGGRAVEGSGFRPDWLLRSVLGQAVWLGPWVMVPLLYAIVQAFGHGARKDPEGWFLLCLAVLPIIVFTVIASWAPVGYHFHWQAPGWLMTLPLLGREAARWLAERRRGSWLWLRLSTMGSVVMIAGLGLLVLTGWGRFLVGPETRDPTLEFSTWEDLAPVLASEDLLTAGKTFAAAVHWTEVGRLDAAVGTRMPVTVLSDDPRNPAFLFDPRSHAGWQGIIAGTPGTMTNPLAVMDQAFDEVETIGAARMRRWGSPAETVMVTRGIGYRPTHDLPMDGSEAESYFTFDRRDLPMAWGDPRRTDDGTSYRAALGPRQYLAVIVDPLVNPTEVTMRLSAPPGGPDREIAVILYGRRMSGEMWKENPPLVTLPGDGRWVDVRFPLRKAPTVGRWYLSLIFETQGVTEPDAEAFRIDSLQVR